MDQQALLKATYLFRGATNDDLASLAGIAAEKKYSQGEFIFNEGDEADAMFIVEMGTVDIVGTGKEFAVVSIGSNQMFGEMALFTHGKRPAAARTREMTTVLRIPFDRLETLLGSKPALATTFYRNACAFLATHLRTLLSDLDRRYF